MPLSFLWRYPTIVGYNDNMSKRQVIMLLGVLIIILPFLGFTSFWDMIINVVAGVVIIGIAYRMAPANMIMPTRKSEKSDNSENISQNTKNISDAGKFVNVSNDSEINSTLNNSDFGIKKENNASSVSDLPFVDHISETEGKVSDIDGKISETADRTTNTN
jgi:hypothetical protein